MKELQKKTNKPTTNKSTQTWVVLITVIIRRSFWSAITNELQSITLCKLRIAGYVITNKF